MGVNLKGIISAREVDLEYFSGKRVAFDAYNMLYQFLTTIRDKVTGECLRDSKGRITSHLSGLFYRTVNLVEAGLKPVFVFDGEPPSFKKRTLEERRETKEIAKKKWEEALERGEEAKTYAQAAAVLTEEMVEDAKELLNAMGLPWIVAKSEGEAQCSYLCMKGIVDFSASQDYDSLLFGSPRLARNLSITGRRKLPRKEVYVEIKPEVIELEEVLKEHGITREQLVMVAMLVGTDYNKGISGVGPKTALKLVKQHKTLENVLKAVKWEDETDPYEIFEFFLNPPVEEDVKVEWKRPDEERIIEFMVEEHDFSRERVEKALEKLMKSYESGRQATLASWFKK